MDSANNLFGCFVSISEGKWDDDQETREAASKRGELFRAYIWGENGICDVLKKLNHSEYGKDLIWSFLNSM